MPCHAMQGYLHRLVDAQTTARVGTHGKGTARKRTRREETMAQVRMICSCSTCLTCLVGVAQSG